VRKRADKQVPVGGDCRTRAQASSSSLEQRDDSDQDHGDARSTDHNTEDVAERPDGTAAAAITGLAESGAIVLGLDVRYYDTNDRCYEIAWSSFEPDASKPANANAADARDAALERLGRIDDQEPPDDTVERRVLITWQPRQAS
jgi:hypothetical protein